MPLACLVDLAADQDIAWSLAESARFLVSYGAFFERGLGHDGVECGCSGEVGKLMKTSACSRNVLFLETFGQDE